MKIINKLKCCEVNGDDTKIGEEVEVEINSHWNSHDRIVLYIPKCSMSFTLIGNEVIRAVNNARNSL